jgi:hypothetical protein
MFGTVELNARKKTGNDTSCFAERNEELRFFIRGIDFLTRGGVRWLVIEMKKGAADGIVLMNEAEALANLGKYEAALAKFRPALAALQTIGDDVNVVTAHLMIIRCHASLDQVSWRSSRRGLAQN